MEPTREGLLEAAKEMHKQKGHVDVVSLAREAGVEVVGVVKPFSNFNAQIEYDRDNNKYSLYVNEAHSIGRQRFSIAHELAHRVLHGEQLMSLGKLARAGSSVLEMEADEFAAELLMPEDAVRDYFDTLQINPEQIDAKVIKRISDQFKVSKEVAIIRLRNLSFYVPYIPLD